MEDQLFLLSMPAPGRTDMCMFEQKLIMTNFNKRLFSLGIAHPGMKTCQFTLCGTHVADRSLILTQNVARLSGALENALSKESL